MSIAPFSPSAPNMCDIAHTVIMVTGGQPGEFHLKDLVSLNEALEAARVYHQSGQLAGNVKWRHR